MRHQRSSFLTSLIKISTSADYDCNGNIIDSHTDAPVLSNFAIDTDGTALVELETGTFVRNFGCVSPNPDPINNPYQLLSAPYTSSLYLLKVQPDGSNSMTLIHSHSGDNFLSPLPNGGGSSPDIVIPDGQGGALAAWTDFSVEPALAHVTRISSSGQSDYTFPSLFMYIYQIVLGDGGPAYVTDSQTVQAFDINTGQIVWTYTSPAVDGIGILAAGNSDTLLTEEENQLHSFTMTSIDSTGTPTVIFPYTSGFPGSSPAYSWNGNWYATISGQNSEIATSVGIVPTSIWAAPEGDPSTSFRAGALCPCEIQTGDSSSNATDVPINNLVPPPGSPNCTSLAGTGPTDLILVGDPGTIGPSGRNHDVKTLFNLAAQTQMNALNAEGDNVIACRVSTIDDFKNGLIGGLGGESLNGQITGGVYYFGHSGEYRATFGPLVFDESGVFVGQSNASNTNILSTNVSDLSVVQTSYNNGNVLGGNAAMWLEGCQSAVKFGGPTSIAQLISNNIARGVYGYSVGTYFSHLTIADDPYVDGTGRTTSQVLPIYMIPAGTPHHKPLPHACVPGGGECAKQ